MAVVDAIHTYDPTHKAYAALPIKLKWPNDVYAENPHENALPPGDPKRWTKICGILVNSSYSGDEFLLVVGMSLSLHRSLLPSSFVPPLPRTKHDI